MTDRAPALGDGARVECPHADRCPGCPLLALSYADQLLEKRARVEKSLAYFAELGKAPLEPTLAASPIVAYRERAKLIAGRNEDGSPAIGLFSRSAGQPDQDHEVLDIPGCRVLSPALLEATTALRGLIGNPPSRAGACLVPEASGGRLSGFDVRAVRSEKVGILLTLVLVGVAPASDEELVASVEALRALPVSWLGIAVNYRDPKSPQVLGPRTEVLWGAEYARDRTGTGHVVTTYGSFAQAHREQAENILNLIGAHLGRTEQGGVWRVLDLYGGSGATSLWFAARGAQVTMVESFAPAAECARRAAAELRLSNVEIETGDAAEVLSKLLFDGRSFDAVIVNPPRRGLAPAVRTAIGALRPLQIAYVSCDPDTLARDLSHLERLGFSTQSIKPVDMIPLTDQVESVALLRLGGATSPRVLYEADDVVATEKPAYATKPSSARYRLLSDDGHTSGFSLVAKTASSFAAWKRELEQGRGSREHLVLCRGQTHGKGRLSQHIRYRRLNRGLGHSLLRVVAAPLITHTEIATQLARIGHPVVGDARRGHRPTNRHFEEKYALDRPFLHASRLVLEGSRTLSIEAPLAGELVLVLDRLALLDSLSPNER